MAWEFLDNLLREGRVRGSGDRARLGKDGEALAAAHLESLGYRILARGWRAAGREIDLVAERGGIVALVEVKTRRKPLLAHPVVAVDWRKRRQIAAAAAAAVDRWSHVAGAFRFDVIGVEWSRQGPSIEHIEDAFRLHP